MGDDGGDELVARLLLRELAARRGDVCRAVRDGLDARRGAQARDEHLRASLLLVALRRHLGDGEHRGGAGYGERLGITRARAAGHDEGAGKRQHAAH